MKEEKEKIEQLAAEYAKDYQGLILERMLTTEKEFETFIISLIM